MEQRKMSEGKAKVHGRSDALVSTDWLAAHLNDQDMRVVDASYFVPGGVEPARQQYAQGHIPGAVFFDINDVADASKSKEHAFPSADIFAAKVGGLGIGNAHHVIAYDHLGGACAAARVWFMFRAFGHAKISVLDGGRTKWAMENRAFTQDARPYPRQVYRAQTPHDRTYAKADILANIAAQHFQILDARSKGRFEGTEPEPRPGLRSGHIPASANLPFLNLLNSATKTWKGDDAIRESFADAGIDLAKPLITSCGSGVSACALALGAYLAGKADTAIYDGSWVEWGQDTGLPVETGHTRIPYRRHSVLDA
jgi:thiosulfate/3-mercaptopyruvate sulfurtransferase